MKYDKFLQEKADLFRKVRKDFSIGKELGLGSISDAHTYPEDGMLLPYSVEDKVMMVNGGLTTRELHLPSEQSPLVFRPYGERNLFVVSVYHVDPYKSGSDYWTTKISDEQLEGLMGLMCAEYLDKIGNVSQINDYHTRIDEIVKDHRYTEHVYKYLMFKKLRLIDANKREGKSGLIDNSANIMEIEKRLESYKVPDLVFTDVKRVIRTAR
ncbi:hypothetical protein KY330_02470 [Candidatus Woesearchaeota archaeon]|nr:hypothetical protein [Candidatus Woesearchaeota archaeon]